MSAETLEPEELDAIRAAIQQSTPSRAGRGLDPEATPIAIIADDRAAERGRPNGLRIAARWARRVERQLTRLCGTRLPIAVTGVETINGAAMRGEIADGWFGGVRAGAHGGLVAVTGGLIESVVARLLGDAGTSAAADRAPSAVARRLFAPAGAAVVTALVEAWHEELGTRLELASGGDDWRHSVADGDLVLLVSLASTVPPGTIRLIARPEMLAVPDAATSTVAPSLRAVLAALGDVPVELEVELGRARLTMSELLALAPGAVITLDGLVEEPVPVTVGGIVKATGKPIVNRGALAVEIAALTRSKDPR